MWLVRRASSFEYLFVHRAVDGLELKRPEARLGGCEVVWVEVWGPSHNGPCLSATPELGVSLHWRVSGGLNEACLARYTWSSSCTEGLLNNSSTSSFLPFGGGDYGFI